MISIPNYREFYQKALVPMNDYDKQHFCREFCRDCECIQANHWLVALEGNPTAADYNTYVWSVVVYPAKETGIFWSLKPPYYKISNCYTFLQAIEESKKLIQNLMDSKLTAKTMTAS